MTTDRPGQDCHTSPSLLYFSTRPLFRRAIVAQARPIDGPTSRPRHASERPISAADSLPNNALEWTIMHQAFAAVRHYMRMLWL